MQPRLDKHFRHWFNVAGQKQDGRGKFQAMNTAHRPGGDPVDWIAVLVERATGVAARHISIEPRAGHASVRRYWRARWDDGTPSSALVMVLPSDAPPEESGKGGPSGPASPRISAILINHVLGRTGEECPDVFDRDVHQAAFGTLRSRCLRDQLRRQVVIEIGQAEAGAFGHGAG